MILSCMVARLVLVQSRRVRGRTLCPFSFCILHFFYVQYNLNGSNTDSSFTVDDSNSFYSPYKILQIAQENKYLGIFFSYFIVELYVVCTH